MTLSSRRERIEQLAGFLDGSLPETAVRSDVRRLAALAGTVTTEIVPPRLDEAERDRIRTRVMAGVHTDLQETAAARTTRGRPTRSARAAVATGVASVLIGGGGVAVAAQEALPGDALYGIKQATESVRVAAAGDLTEQGRLELALAAERLTEITAAVERGGVRDDSLIDTLRRMDARSRTGAETLARVAERSSQPELLEEVARFTELQTGGLVEVFDELPVQVRPHAEDSLATLRAIREELLAPLLGADADVASAELARTLEPVLRSSPLPMPPRLEQPTAPDEAPVTDVSPPRPADDAPATETPPVEVETPQPTLPRPRTGGTGGDDERTIVPRLPGPLDGVGRTVDDTVGGVLDGTGELLDDTTGAVDDVLDEVGGTVGGLLDDTLDGLGGLLGGSSTD